MTDLTSQAMHDYLKTIYDICQRQGRASTGQIAEELNITPASVTGMLKKMAAADPPLLDYRKHHGVALTVAGEKQALLTIRRHRLLECFLHETLGYGWDEVHEEAERLEHAVSGALDRKIADLLQDPERDPHGSPIPTRDLRLVEEPGTALDTITPQSVVQVQSVNDEDAALLRYLAEIGLTPGVTLTVLEPLPFSDHVRIMLGSCQEPLNIGRRVAAEVFVKQQNADGAEEFMNPASKENR